MHDRLVGRRGMLFEDCGGALCAVQRNDVYPGGTNSSIHWDRGSCFGARSWTTVCAWVSRALSLGMPTVASRPVFLSRNSSSSRRRTPARKSHAFFSNSQALQDPQAFSLVTTRGYEGDNVEVHVSLTVEELRLCQDSRSVSELVLFKWCLSRTGLRR